MYLLTPPPAVCASQKQQLSSHLPSSSSIVSYKFPPEPAKSQCGHSAAEAIALNCTYDPLQVQWLPAHCPQDHLSDFLSAAGKDPIDGTVPSSTGQWRYYYDQSGKKEISSFEELSKLPHEQRYWTTESEHRFHCTFVLMRIHAALLRARKGDLVMDGKTLNPSHAKHCIFQLAGMAKSHYDDKLLAHGNVGYGSC
ncbi:hypothetical protein CC80DRAFT_423272 [Byssothecium circinans]|uniref:Uncharacterized protein n=1 Tax=Byssothecium circinans TaxID=147558 RepID=A0A6A5TSW3_9PLEO|nr:hypothetical protein CC80DRAFT_423272 [Byssothecium circinans]